MIFELPDNHIFLKNPARAKDCLEFIGTLFAPKNDTDYTQFKDILVELKRLPFPFDLRAAGENAEKWQKFFPGIDIPKVVAGFGSKFMSKADADKYYNHYNLIWKDLVEVENGKGYRRGERHMKKLLEQDKIMFEKPIPMTPERMAEIKKMFDEALHGRSFEMPTKKIVNIEQEIEEQRNRLFNSEIIYESEMIENEQN